MNERFLKYYEQELHHIREMGGEFAQRFPKIAGRLGLDAFECADPYVERLLEGFAFLAARVQIKMDDEHPQFIQNLLGIVYPHYLAPLPSTAIVEFHPDLTEGSLAEGFGLPRETVLRSIQAKGEATSCIYRTAHEVTLWPLEVAQAQYVSGSSNSHTTSGVGGIKATLRLRLRTTSGFSFEQLALEELVFYLHGRGDLPLQIYTQLFSNLAAVVVQQPGADADRGEILDKRHLRRIGYEDDEALLPYPPRSFQGYRLLQEFFALHQRYAFVGLTGLSAAVQKCKGNELDILFLLDQSDPSLEHAIDKDLFRLFCSPVVNLFPKRAERIHLSDRQNEHHVVADRTRPLDFEIHQIERVAGHGSGMGEVRVFEPFYGHRSRTREGEGGAYYTFRRQQRILSEAERLRGMRSSYAGSEIHLSLVDAQSPPYSTELRQLSIETLCTNRDLPLNMSVGLGKTDFTLQASAPVDAVKVLAGPTKPQPSRAEGETAWRLISHLSLNYLSLADASADEGAMALRELLSLYCSGDEGAQKQTEVLRNVAAKPIHRPVMAQGAPSFARGLEVAVTFEEGALRRGWAFLLGAVLERFFSRYVSVNSFTETVIRSADRGEVKRWPARIGQRWIF